MREFYRVSDFRAMLDKIESLGDSVFSMAFVDPKSYVSIEQPLNGVFFSPVDEQQPSFGLVASLSVWECYDLSQGAKQE